MLCEKLMYRIPNNKCFMSIPFAKDMLQTCFRTEDWEKDFKWKKVNPS